MLDYIKRYPSMIKDSINLTNESELKHYTFDKIVVCGMGGSAIGGDILSDILRYSHDFVVHVSRRYRLPKFVDENTLVFIVSYSGRTEETLSQFVDARKTGAKMICITSDGYLLEWCELLGIPHVKLPVGFQPRVALPYLVFPMIQYLQKISDDIDFDSDIEETIKLLEYLIMDKNQESDIKSSADLVKNHRIRVYGSDEYESAVRRIKTQINENSKVPSSFELFPEMDHNEIVGYENNSLNKEDYVIFLRDENESSEMRTRIDVTKKIIRDDVSGIIELTSFGNSKMTKLFSFILMGDMLSYYIAKSNNVAPEKTDNIDTLKRLLKEKSNLQEKLEKDIV